MNIPDGWLKQCPHCSIALIVDAPINVMARWKDMLDQFSFNRIAMVGGWERLGLERSVPIDSCDLATCDAAYLGDLIVNDLVCPRCEHSLHLSAPKDADNYPGRGT